MVRGKLKLGWQGKYMNDNSTWEHYLGWQGKYMNDNGTWEHYLGRQGRHMNGNAANETQSRLTRQVHEW